MKKFNSYEFICTDADLIVRGGEISFRTYTDKAGVFGSAGSAVFYNDGTRDTQNRLVGKFFKIGQSFAKLLASASQTDADGKKLWQFFLNTPLTEGSPNGDYTDADGNIVPIEELGDYDKNVEKVRSGEWKQHGVKLRLLDTDADAEMAMGIEMRKIDAQMAAARLDDDTLIEVGALIGEFGKPDTRMRKKVFDFAGKKPVDFNKYLNSGDRAVRALIRKGIADKILSQKGTMIMWEETVLGGDEDAAVATLVNDPKVFESLQSKLNFKVDKKVAPAKKK